MQGYARGTYGSGCKMPGECREMQRNARGMHGYVCKVPVESRGMPGVRMGVGAKCQGMKGDGSQCKVQSARGIQGNARECQGIAWEWMQSAMGMQGYAGGTYG